MSRKRDSNPRLTHYECNIRPPFNVLVFNQL
nr:MAG TPA: hypothetical protein [Caudoviricetes sp.]